MSDDENITTSITFDITKVNVVRDRQGADKIYFELTNESARHIHGSFYDFYRGADLKLEVTRGRGEEVLSGLDVPPNIIEVIDVAKMSGPLPKFGKTPPKSA